MSKKLTLEDLEFDIHCVSMFVENIKDKLYNKNKHENLFYMTTSDLEDGLDNLKRESLSTILNKYMIKKELTPPDIYKITGDTHTTISRIVNGTTKNPKKETMLKIAIALRCTEEEYVELMDSAGFTTYKSLTDRIVYVAIMNGEYDPIEIDIFLEAKGEKALFGKE